MAFNILAWFIWDFGGNFHVDRLGWIYDVIHASWFNPFEPNGSTKSWLGPNGFSFFESSQEICHECQLASSYGDLILDF
jgi:hypothetical protein